MLTRFLCLSNFGVGLNPEANFSNTVAYLNLAPRLPARRAIQFRYTDWIWVTVIFRGLFFTHQ